MSGVCADALVAVRAAEHARRVRVGLGAVTDLGLLDLLMDLPVGAPVAVNPQVVSVLTRLPGMVEVSDRAATRVVDQPAVVHAAVVSGPGWRPLLRRASAFEGVCQRIVLLDAPARGLASRLWEADVLGVGVWRRTASGEIEEMLAPAAFVPSFIKPARWRFQEYAYAAYLRQGEWGEPTTPTSSTGIGATIGAGVSARNQPGSLPAAPGRRSRRTDAASHPRQGSFPFD